MEEAKRTKGRSEMFEESVFLLEPKWFLTRTKMVGENFSSVGDLLNNEEETDWVVVNC